MMQTHFDYKPFKLKDFSAPEDSRQHGFVRAQFPTADAASLAEVIKEAAPAPEPSFNGAELDAARAQAFQEGLLKGREDTEQAMDMADRQQQQLLSALVSDLLSRLDDELGAIKAAQENQRKEVGTLVLLLAKKLAGNALTSQPLGAVEPMITDCLNMLNGEKKLSLIVSPDVVEPLKAFVAVHARDGQAVEVLADPGMHVGDCRVQWPSGKAERNHEAIWREIETIVTRSMSPAIKPESSGHQ